jgi:hypothetical protein
MNCYVCARAGKAERSAVATCPHCQAGLCLEHVEATARDSGPGGMRIACDHETWVAPARRVS